ncbi:hypothetical protein C7S18_15165 [Ahniella affigens]|uniref:Uncharacterized protein n=2 Tax=Ahniella affigens TaxID=2021234 RepID=A0A2P1PUC9_9GAMM|nr:hypothetical protein C7S18_15165 [Ahniella affigens]
MLGALVLSSGVWADVTSLEKDRGHLQLGDKKSQTTGKQLNGVTRGFPALSLIDDSGLDYQVLSDAGSSIATSSDSGAVGEASYTAAVTATTMNGGTEQATLEDAYDGYSGICLSNNGGTGPCDAGLGGKSINGFNYEAYFNNGPPTLDASCSNRQILFPSQSVYPNIVVSRKVFVPLNDEFIRWQTLITNTSASAATINLITANDLGSDANTLIDRTSSGDAVVTDADQWVTTFQNYSGVSTSDPRLAHVFGGPGAAVSAGGISFTNGDDRPFWHYVLNIQSGQTVNVVTFSSGQPSRADAAAKAAQLVALSGNAASCMSPAELAQVVNYAAAAGPVNRDVPMMDRRVLLAVMGMLLALGFVALRRNSL